MTAAADPRLRRAGIAKLLGTKGDQVLEVFMQKYAIYLGRSSKNSQVDVVLGDSMSLSRKHACIQFNFQSRCFELVVMGKNGVNIQGDVITPERGPIALNSGDRIRTGDCDLYFLLPAQPVPQEVSTRNGVGTASQAQASQHVGGSAGNQSAFSPDPASNAPEAFAANSSSPLQHEVVNGMNNSGPGPMELDDPMLQQPWSQMSNEGSAVHATVGNLLNAGVSRMQEDIIRSGFMGDFRAGNGGGHPVSNVSPAGEDPAIAAQIAQALSVSHMQQQLSRH